MSDTPSFPTLKFYILEGREIRAVDHAEFVRWYVGVGRFPPVAYDVIGEVTVSTIFIGSSRATPPRVFETFVMGGRYDGMQLSAISWEDAENQHSATVKLIRETLN